MIDTATILEAVASVLFVIIIRYYFQIFFTARKSYPVQIIAWIIYAVIHEWVDVTQTGILTVVVSDVVMLFIIVCLLYEGSKKEVFLYVIFFDALGMLIEMIVACLLYLMDGSVENYTNGMYFAGSVMSKILIITIVFVIRNRYGMDKSRNLPFKEMVFIMFIPLASIYIIYIIYSLAIKNGYLQPTTMVAIINTLALDITIYYVIRLLDDRGQILKKNALFERQRRMWDEQIDRYNKISREIKQLNHDSKHSYVLIKELYEKHDFEKLEEYLNILIPEYNLNKNNVVNTGNIAVDSIINHKYLKAVEQGIDMDVQMEIPEGLSINYGDLCVILGNALDNAIEATTRYKEGKQFIKLVMLYRKCNLVITVKNSFDGFVKKERNGGYQTIKNDKNSHGFGIGSIKKAVDKYDGVVDIGIKEKIFELKILIYSL